MKNYVQPGENITVPAPADVTAGQLVLVGSLVGVAQAAALSGEDVVLVRRGVFVLAKTSAQAWTVGAKIYRDATTGAATTTATSNLLIGVAAAVADNPSAEGRVLLDGAVR